MRIVVAMSGGVDSSVVAGLLAEQGHEVIGVHMKLHDAPAAPLGGSSKTCCGLDDSLDARAVCDTIGAKFYVMDLREAFQKAVVDDFTAAYKEGRTPSPCIQCNGVLKFRVLLQRAKALGADKLATGHYARITDDGRLQEAVDLSKDQSYFLFPATREALSQSLFPLGGMTKAEVRVHARRLGLVTADKPESQEICFLPQGNHAELVRARFGDGAGEIVDQTGRRIGQHDGYYRFTVGQRRGLGLPPGMYVSEINPDTRQVIVGQETDLMKSQLVARGLNWFLPPEEAETARIRHHGDKLPVQVRMNESGAAVVSFDSAAKAPAKGQAVVFYRGADVVGGGWITKV